MLFLPLQVQFGNSDLYFICRLMPKGTGAGALDITKCSHEIADACWMPLEQFKKQTRHSMLAVVADMLDKPEEKELTRFVSLLLLLLLLLRCFFVWMVQ